MDKKPWYDRRKDDDFTSKHSGGRRRADGRPGRTPGRKSIEGRVARARVNNWPRGRS